MLLEVLLKGLRNLLYFIGGLAQPLASLMVSDKLLKFYELHLSNVKNLDLELTNFIKYLLYAWHCTRS